MLLPFAHLCAAAAFAGDAQQVEARPLGRISFRPEIGLNRHDSHWDADGTDRVVPLRTNLGLDAGLVHDVRAVFELQSYGTCDHQRWPVGFRRGAVPGHHRAARHAPHAGRSARGADRGGPGRHRHAHRARQLLRRAPSRGLAAKGRHRPRGLDPVWHPLCALDTTAGEDARQAVSATSTGMPAAPSRGAVSSASVPLGDAHVGQLGADGYTLLVLEPGDTDTKAFENTSAPPADAGTEHGVAGDLWWAWPITFDLSRELCSSAMHPGALVTDAPGVADLLLRVYTSLEVVF